MTDASRAADKLERLFPYPADWVGHDDEYDICKRCAIEDAILELQADAADKPADEAADEAADEERQGTVVVVADSSFGNRSLHFPEATQLEIGDYGELILSTDNDEAVATFARGAWLYEYAEEELA